MMWPFRKNYSNPPATTSPPPLPPMRPVNSLCTSKRDLDYAEAIRLLVVIYEWTGFKETEWARSVHKLLTTEIDKIYFAKQVKCIRESPEVSHNGDLNENCYCTEGSIYEVDYHLWSSQNGWMVCITGELHKAVDFINWDNRHGQ